MKVNLSQTSHIHLDFEINQIHFQQYIASKGKCQLAKICLAIAFVLQLDFHLFLEDKIK